MRRILCILLAGVILAGCTVPKSDPVQSVQEPVDTTAEAVLEEEETVMKLKIDDTEVEVIWQQNEAVETLRKAVKDEALQVQLSRYGGFEQVGSLGMKLPRSDAQTVTEKGDIVLYSGDQIVIFTGSNTWAYTRLGRIADADADVLTQDHDAVITIYTEE